MTKFLKTKLYQDNPKSFAARKERIVNCFLDLSKGDLAFVISDTRLVQEYASIAWRKRVEEEN